MIRLRLERGAGAVLSMTLGLACGPSTALPLLDTRECPHDRPPKEIPLAEDTQNIPEIHDCQRFILVSNDDNDVWIYSDEFFAIYTSANVADAFELLRTDPGRQFGRPVADIRSGEAYSALGIEPGQNCLVMYREGLGDGLQAKMIPLGYTEDGGPCVGTNAVDVDQHAGTELIVYQTRHGLALSDYPPVVRWDWDSTNNRQYIGIACGGAWCEVGDSSLTRESLSPTYSGGANDVGRRVREVKGWYDEQYLAFPTRGGLVPTRLFGTIFPSGGLDASLTSATTVGEWNPVASIRVRNDGADHVHVHHYAKYNLVPDGVETRLYLCHGTLDDCDVPSRALADSPTCEPDEIYPQAVVQMWWLRYDHPGLASRFRCAKFYPTPPGISARGTVRWRWTLDDEGGWIACPSGCCEGL